MMKAFNTMKSAEFVGIKGYTNKQNEVADLVILTNINWTNAKEKDLSTLKSLTDADLSDIAAQYSLPVETLKVALAELIDSAEKNLSEDLNEHTAQSVAQVDTYIHLTPAIKLHRETLEVYVCGMVNNKTVLVPGEYKTVNKREKTLCKEAITKHCDLRAGKYREYKIGQMERFTITGQTIQMK